MSNTTPECPEALYDPETDTLFRCIQGPGRHEWHQDRYATRWRDPMADVDLSQVDSPFTNDPWAETSQPSLCVRCNNSGVDPEDSDPGSGTTHHSMGEPPTLEPCRNCGPGEAAST